MGLRQWLGQKKANRLIAQLFSDDDLQTLTLINSKDYTPEQEPRIREFLEEYAGYRTKKTDRLRTQYGIKEQQHL